MGLLTSLYESFKGRRERRTLRSGTESELLDLAQGMIQGGQEEHALTFLHDALKRYPESFELRETAEYLEKALCCRAINESIPLLDQDPSAELRARLADLYWRTGDMQTALDLGREAIQIDADDPSGYRVLGKIYLEQFRITCGSIEGMNALRCLFKAHTLMPEDSSVLLRLAEIFVILKAPGAASKFLAPVQRVFPTDAQVVDLAQRVDALPAETTTQIQDLFLRLEQERSGEIPVEATGVTLPHSASSALTSMTSGLSDADGCFLVGGDRTIVWSAYAHEFDVEACGQSFGLLADTAKQLSKRMGIGDFQRLTLQSPSLNVLLGCMGEQISLVHMGPDVKKQDAEALYERMREKVLEKAGEVKS